MTFRNVFYNVHNLFKSTPSISYLPLLLFIHIIVMVVLYTISFTYYLFVVYIPTIKM
jgi:hypothetical protein